MRKPILVQRSSLCISSRRIIFVLAILLFVSPSILHAQIQNGSFNFDGRLRSYMVYLPSNYTGGTKLPLVIYLHSYGWTAQQGMNYTQLNQVAEASDFVVVYPSAIPNWYSEIGDNSTNVDDVGFINALIDVMINNYSIDPERIYACGYSNGGMMSYKLAFQLSNRIAAIASVGGTIRTYTPESLNPVRPVPVLEIHGTSDTWVLINGEPGQLSVDQALSIWTNFNNCVQTDTTVLPDLDPTDGCTVEKTTYTNPSDNCSVVYYKVINGGHTWPGAGPPGYAAGNTNQDINAGVEIWNFFRNYRRVTLPAVDLNGDGKVDFEDFSMLAQYWHQEQSPLTDHRLDSKYLAVLVEDWLNDSRLTAHWKLDESEGFEVPDCVGGHNGFVITENPLWRPTGGRIGGALQLNGINDYAFVSFDLDPAERPFSAFAWVKSGTAGKAIISQANLKVGRTVILGSTWLGTDASDGTLVTTLMESANGPLESDSVITDGRWHHVGLVYDLDGLCRRLYVDGLEVAGDSSPVGGVSSTGSLHFGAGKNLDADSFFCGLIDDVCIYNAALSSEEIEELAR